VTSSTQAPFLWVSRIVTPATELCSDWHSLLMACHSTEKNEPINPLQWSQSSVPLTFKYLYFFKLKIHMIINVCHLQCKKMNTTIKNIILKMSLNYMIDQIQCILSLNAFKSKIYTDNLQYYFLCTEHVNNSSMWEWLFLVHIVVYSVSHTDYVDDPLFFINSCFLCL
jgi:hypothetical protein